MQNVKLAEEKLTSYLGIRHASLTSKGRITLLIALKALGISFGDACIQMNENNRRKALVPTGLINNLKIDDVKSPFGRKDRMDIYYIYGLKGKIREEILKRLRTKEKYTFWSLPWQCPYGSTAKELSKQLIFFEMSYVNEKGIRLIVSTLSGASKNQSNLAL